MKSKKFNFMLKFRGGVICILLVTLMFSCQKESKNDSKVQNTKILLMDVPIVEGRFAFKSKEEYKEVAKDYYKHQKEYKEYLLEIDFKSFLTQKEKFKKEIKDEMTTEQVVALVKKYNLSINSENEVEMPFKMSYHNAFSNINHEISVESRITKINEKIASINTTYNSGIRSSPLDRHCTSNQEWDGGFWCANHRFKGEVCTEYEVDFADSFNGCGSEFVGQAKSILFKKVGLIWTNIDADEISAQSNHTIFSTRVGFRQEAYLGNPKQTNLNDDEVSIGNFFRVGSINDFCDPITSINRGVVNANSIHTCYESGKCGKRSTVTINNCN